MRSRLQSAVGLLSILSFLFLAASAICAAQNSTATKDPIALAALAQMASATGWNVGSLPADAVATGSVTPVGQGGSSVTLKMRGLGQFRIDTQVGSGVRSMVLNNGEISLTLPDGTSKALSAQDALSIWAVDVPTFSNIPLAATSPTISVTSLGVEVANGVSCNKIQLTNLVDPNSRLAPLASEVASIILWLDVSTGLPVQVQYEGIASDNSAATVAHVRQFSNYQTVNGFQFAFTQQEFVNGRSRFTLQLSSVALNVGLTDADFPVASAQQGEF